MKKSCFFLSIFSFLFLLNAFSQEEILLTIDDHKVTREEFERIYHKNNSSAMYENKNVDEYLELFINFKLKVIEAEALGYDTVTSFIKELEGYRDQLAKPYLEDKEVTESLLREAYDRTVNQVSASHILIRVDQNASTSDTAEAYKKIMNIRKRILSGEPFDKVAREASDDPSAKTNGGQLGWFGAFRMVYPFEDVAFKTSVGDISMPFRTQYGYHIIKNEGVRASKGRVKIAHILFLAQNEDDNARKEKQEKVNECSNRLKNGESFSELVKIYTEDQRSASRSGELGWYSSEAFSPEMEAAIYSMSDSGDISEPVAMEYGWHIFKLLDKKPVDPFELMKSDLEKKVFNDVRSKKLNDFFVEKIMKENNFREYKENIKPVVAMIDENIYEGSWDATIAEHLIDPVISFGDKNYFQNELALFVARQKKINKNLTITELVNTIYDDFVKTKAIDFEKGRLESKYPDFRNLMKEYHDGILLFNLTDDMVWNKAVKDTAGLLAFYEKNKQQYMWNDRADISIYSFENKSLTNKIVAEAKKRSKSKISADKFNKTICGNDSVKCVNVKDLKIEKEDIKKYAGLSWKKDAHIVNEKDTKNEVIVVNNLLPPQVKKLDEARGIITADYQTYLENKWIASLREKYKVTVDEEVLKKVK
jgi:peptidyl-prolyl cis-trans isomerase SurA